jgi:hypothetical protein
VQQYPKGTQSLVEKSKSRRYDCRWWLLHKKIAKDEKAGDVPSQGLWKFKKYSSTRWENAKCSLDTIGTQESGLVPRCLWEIKGQCLHWYTDKAFKGKVL